LLLLAHVIRITASWGFRLHLLQEFCIEAEPLHPVAVCIPPGARLPVRDIPEELQRVHKIGSVEEVTFTQLSAAENTHRDAIRLMNGTQVSLQRLREGQKVRVMALQLTTPDARALEVGVGSRRH
jgi:hypothetical protein